MPRTEANGIELEFETFGHETHEPLLLIIGLGGQMLLWNEEFCEMLAKQGHFVIRFDNRDVGLSTWCDDLGLPDMMALFASLGTGTTPEAPYSLDDMADDAVAILDALGLERAHVCGASMGGMIAQATAIRHTDRVKSLTSIMSSPSDPGLPGPSDAARAALLEPAPRERDAYIEYSVRTGRAFTGDGFPYDEDERRKVAGLIFDRAFDPEGVARQAAAVFGARPRGEELGRVTTPCLVVHGSADPLVPLGAGEATAAAIPNAKLEVIPGMGHDLPRGTWDRIISTLAAHTQRAEEA